MIERPKFTFEYVDRGYLDSLFQLGHVHVIDHVMCTGHLVDVGPSSPLDFPPA